MTDLKSSSASKSAKNNNFFTLPFFVLSFLGFLDTAYLTIIHYQNVLPPCSLAHGCEKVLTSQFSTIDGVPIQIPGMVFYATLMVLVVLYGQTANKLFFKLLTIIVASGLFVSVILFGLQAFILKAFCQYCLASEGIILLLFGLTMGKLLTRKALGVGKTVRAIEEVRT